MQLPDEFEDADLTDEQRKEMEELALVAEEQDAFDRVGFEGEATDSLVEDLQKIDKENDEDAECEEDESAIV